VPTHTWDNNGNLLSDGTSTYTYDKANRLSSVTQGSDTYSFTYNGLGDRLQQTINAQTTNYTLDLNAGLTQVLSDGTSTYLYGLGRVAEYESGWTYYLTDALGSVRQLTSSAAGITLTQTYEPYGHVLDSTGTGLSNYGFANEWTDGTGLQHLRARYLDTGIGRFISRDVWGGNYNSPGSLNRWMYVEGNPVNWTDPSGKKRVCPTGYIHTEQNECIKLPQKIGRHKWRAKPLNVGVVCDWRGICFLSPFAEGIYDPDCNPMGYALYSILYPGQSLGEIYDTIVIHHAGNTNNPTIQDIQNEHIREGLADIGYHYIVGKDGLVYEGRLIGARGAHVEGGNSHKIGILVVGDFEPGDFIELPFFGEIKISDEPADIISPQQEASLESLVAYLDFLYGIEEIGGHNKYNDTRCPGVNLKSTVNYLNQKYGKGY
jgi:RHS repeat-associated protein